MIIEEKTIDKLAEVICGDGREGYRSGPQLVKFFNALGFSDRYQQGFPTRKTYAIDRISKINGTPELDKCIKASFDPREFAERILVLDELIAKFNIYLEFDGWHLKRNGSHIVFEKATNISALDKQPDSTEEIFLMRQFPNPKLDTLNIESNLKVILETRLEEVARCFTSCCSLSAVILCGSILEGILLSIALQNTSKFVESKSAPLAQGKVKNIMDWRLVDLIQVSYEQQFIDQDIWKFSSIMREYRNYVHPYAQSLSNFSPTLHTAKICYQVVLGTIGQLMDVIKQSPSQAFS